MSFKYIQKFSPIVLLKNLLLGLKIKVDLQKKGVIIVCQMGKVGSSAILKTLKSLNLSKPILHVHHLTYDAIDGIEKKYANLSKPIPGHICTSRILLNDIKNNVDGVNKKFKIVTFVREPVARNISAFFQNLDLLFQDINYQDIDSVKTEMLIEHFLHTYSHEVPLMWFDTQFKPVFGFDVFSSNFPKSKGYKIYKGRHPDILLLRLENINECSQGAFKEFLGIERFTLINDNRGSEKKYGDLYKNFKDSIKLPSDLIEKMYSSRYAQHFYSEEEIDKFRARWSE